MLINLSLRSTPEARLIYTLLFGLSRAFTKDIRLAHQEPDFIIRVLRHFLDIEPIHRHIEALFYGALHRIGSQFIRLLNQGQLFLTEFRQHMAAHVAGRRSPHADPYTWHFLRVQMPDDVVQSVLTARRAFEAQSQSPYWKGNIVQTR